MIVTTTQNPINISGMAVKIEEEVIIVCPSTMMGISTWVKLVSLRRENCVAHLGPVFAVRKIATASVLDFVAMIEIVSLCKNTLFVELCQTALSKFANSS
jgi:hypothetical protein